MNVKTSIYGFLLLMASLISTTAGAQSFEVSVNRDQVPSNSSVQVTYTIKNADKVKNFRAPDFSPFRSRGPSSSTSMQIVNGSVSKSESYTYVLIPTKKGSFTIPPAIATINGQKKTTESITIEVTDAIDQGKQQETQGGSGPNEGAIDEAKIAENLFVRVIPDKSTIYKGQQVNLTYKLYSRVSLRNIQMTKQPQYNNFLSREIELSNQAKQQKIEVFDGKEFRTQTFNKVALFPTQAGKIEVPPIEFDAEILYREQDPFFRSSFFTRTRSVPYSFKSNRITLDIEDLPGTPPQGYTGGVGQFNYEVNYDRTETKAGDPITLKIRISGNGNINLVNMETPDFPASFDVFDPKVKENVSNASSVVNGSKTYEYLLIPRGGGSFEMPDLNFSHFNPETGEFIAKNFEGPVIEVSGQAIDGASGAGAVAGGGQEIDVLNEDIRFIQEGKVDNQSTASPFGSWWYWLLSGLPLLSLFVLPAALSSYRLKQREKAARGGFAAQHALKRLQALKSGKEEAGDKLAGLQQILWNYVSEKLQAPIAQLTKEKAVDLMEGEKMNQEGILSWKGLLDETEAMAYAPYGQKEIGDLAERAEACIKTLES